ncbi:hypothetical protein ACLB2K_024399 [Fragaria x ananassa]
MNKLSSSFLNPLKPQTQLTPTATTTTRAFNAIINRLSSQRSHHEVLAAFSSMLKAHIPPDTHTFPSLLKACTSLNLFGHGVSLHQRVVVNGFFSDAYIASSLINLYAKLGHVQNARKVFDTMPERKNVVPWTSIIGCYSRAGSVEVAFGMFSEMRHDGIHPSSVTLLSLLSGASEVAHVQCLHGCAVVYGFESDMCLVNSMLNVYCKCGRVEDGRDLFEYMNGRDTVSWNSLISGYAQSGDVREVFQLLYKMRVEGVVPDKQTYASVAATQSDVRLGKSVHGQILRSGFEVDSHVETAVIVMYLKCGNVDLAFRIFERTMHKDVILWTAMISGLAQNDSADRALMVFCQMLESRTEPSSATIASALAACAQLGSFELGTSIHGYVLRQGMRLDIPAQNSLVTMYAKCARLDQSRAAFQSMSKRDLVSWNAIVAGYAQNGHLGEALVLFSEMRATLQKPDSLPWSPFSKFVLPLERSIKESGSTASLLEVVSDHASWCFVEMSEQDLVSWSTIISGYGCHGKADTALEFRAGKVEEAYDFYKRVFPEPDVLGILLDAYRTKGNVVLGDIIAGEIFRLKPADAGNYVQLAHNRWDDVGEAWNQMKALGLKKLPGWSFIELHGTITTFFTDHNSNPQIDDVVSLLKILSNEMRKSSLRNWDGVE